MQIQINGKQMDVGDALRSHVESRLESGVGKYADNAVDAHVTFSRERSFFKADAQVHLSTGLVAQATSSDPDVYAAFEGCVERIEKQLRRYKRRIKSYTERRDSADVVPAAAYVIAGGEHHEDAEPTTLDPLIVAEMTMDIRTASVGEAVMQMELAHAPFLLFRNERHGGLNVVFRREDGNIGWVDPTILTPRAS
jgi:ribosomal subunit interface protein